MSYATVCMGSILMSAAAWKYAAISLALDALALDALAPDATFSCLDHHIQWGNSLLGATPALLAQGIPDAAFTPIAGDDKAVAAALRKRNQYERLGQMA